MALVLIASAIVAALWAVWLFRNRSVPGFVRYLPAFLLATAVGAAAVSMFMLYKAYFAIQYVSADQKAAQLATWIAFSRNVLAVCFIIILAACIMMGVFTFSGRFRRSPQRETEERLRLYVHGTVKEEDSADPDHKKHQDP